VILLISPDALNKASYNPTINFIKLRKINCTFLEQVFGQATGGASTSDGGAYKNKN